ncbi:MAG: mechanosensitive ion channel family protein [Gammaproteobacteria bacterium]|nr:mechanosensitive ion channel family protein [Gammaproteobacteria bacterium]
MDVKDLFTGPVNLAGIEYAWVVEVFIVVLLVVTANFLLRIFLNRVHARLQQTDNPWDDAVLDAARRPLSLAVWVVGLTFAADIILQETGAAIFSAGDTMRDVGVIVALTWFLTGIVARMQARIIERAETGDERADRSTVEAFGKLIRLSIVITAALVVLQTLGYSISGVLAFGGIGGIAIGFAAKDLLANFFGGLMIYLDRPFAVGDWIRSPDRELEGTVEYIGWRLTRIRTFDKRPLYVPNSIFTNIAVENPSRMSHRRIYETIGVRYDDLGKMNALVADVKTLLREHDEIDQSQTLMVNFDSFGDSSCNFFIYAFTKTTVWTRYHEVKHEVLLAIADTIEKAGAEIAFPTTTVHIPQGLQVQTDQES